MKRPLLLIIALLVLSFILGWWRAGSYVAAGTADDADWKAPEFASSTNIKSTAAAIRASSLFLLSRKAEQARKAQANQASAVPVNVPKAAPPFPTFAGAFKSNGIHYVTLVLATGEVLTIKSGQELPSGWLIKDINLEQVIAVFDDEETRFPVRTYLDTAFDEPETENPNGGGD